MLNRSRKDPASIWFGFKRVVLDEVQKSPDLLNAVKLAVDADPEMRFILSGSANLLWVRNVAESLSGRAVYFSLQPMTYGEIHGWKSPN